MSIVGEWSKVICPVHNTEVLECTRCKSRYHTEELAYEHWRYIHIEGADIQFK